MSSHILSEIELMCDKVAFIQQGTLIKVENLKEIKKDNDIVAFKTSKLHELKTLFETKNLKCKTLGEDTIHVTIKAFELENLISDVSSAKIPFTGVYEVKESLEEKYLRTIGDE